jgi:hypothetical protein
VPLEPSDAVGPALAHLDQREALDLPGFEAGLAWMISSVEMPIHCSTTGDSGDRLRVRPASSRTFLRMGTILNSVAHCRLIIPIDTVSFAVRRVPIATTSPSSSSSRTGTSVPAGVRVLVKAGMEAQLAVAGGGELLADIACRHDMDREGRDVWRHQPGEMVVDRFGLPAGIGEDGAVWHRADVAISAMVVDCTLAPSERARRLIGEGP